MSKLPAIQFLIGGLRSGRGLSGNRQQGNVDADEIGGMRKTKSGRDKRPPIAPVGREAAIAEYLCHQTRQNIRNLLQTASESIYHGTQGASWARSTRVGNRDPSSPQELLRRAAAVLSQEANKPQAAPFGCADEMRTLSQFCAIWHMLSSYVPAEMVEMVETGDQTKTWISADFTGVLRGNGWCCQTGLNCRPLHCLFEPLLVLRVGSREVRPVMLHERRSAWS
jgi:hypothetical protein